MIRFTLCLSTLIVLSPLLAQDIHFSQFYNTPLVMNPANTGVFYGAQRTKVGHRNQWSNIVPWQTVSASYDRKFISKFCRDVTSFFSGGILLNYDRSGEPDLTLSNINLTGSYTVLLDASNLLTIGTLFGYATRGFEPSTLTWDRQWDIAEFDFNRGLSSGESFSSERVSYLESAVGLNYRWQKSSRTHFDLGLGLYHFVEPGLSYYDIANTRLFRRYSFSAVGQMKTSEKLDFQVFAMLQFQGPYREATLGAVKKIYLNTTPGRHTELHLGMGHRFDVAWFPIVAMQYNNFYGSISYDLDATNINEQKGVQPNTIEIHFGYILDNPKWEKRCPIY